MQLLPALLAAASSAAAATAAQAPPKRYEPTWPSLMSRPLPAWYDDAKIGVFIHWGVYSVPSFGCAGCGPAEWYWHSLRGGADPVVNGKRVPCCGLQTRPQVVAFHEKMYNNMSYTNFGPMFTAEFFEPDAWAALFKKAGIKYVVLTSKHHEGWTNWCSAEAFGWNACDNGPKRDLVGDLTASVKAAGLHMGLYLSMYEWYHPLYTQDAANNFTTSRYVDEVYWPQAKEINTKYQPDLLWSDGDVGDSSWWRSAELLAWLYNEAPNRETIVVNDRWGTDNPPIGSGKHFGGYFSGADRQHASAAMLQHKWESAFTIDSANWGFARNDPLADYLNITTILANVVSTVAYGGNVLVNIGPAHDGTIPAIFQDRLTQMGAWLEINGEAIYGSKRWRVQNDTAIDPEVSATQGVYYTTTAHNNNNTLSSEGAVYAIALHWPAGNRLLLQAPVTTPATTVTMLGCAKPMAWEKTAVAAAAAATTTSGGGIEITVPALAPTELPSLHGPWVFKLTGVL
jgi:alpha-L-fucosidase